MKKLLIAVVMALAFACASSEAPAADAYDVLLAHLDYLEQDSAATDQLVSTIDSGDFDAMDDAAQVGYDYLSAILPTPPYDDGSVEMAATDAMDAMVAASTSLAAAMQARLDASTAALAAVNFAANGQYDDAVAAYQSAAYDDPMGFGIFQMDLWELVDRVADAQYWLANWPEDPGGMMP